MDNVVVGQKVNRFKVQRAKELRQASTEAERLLWQHLRRNGLNGLHFRRQQIIDGFIVDFYCNFVGLVVEVDGGAHQQQTEQDAERDSALSLRGLQVLRVRNEEVLGKIDNVLAKIEEVAVAHIPSASGKLNRLPSPRRRGDGGEVNPLGGKVWQ